MEALLSVSHAILHTWSRFLKRRPLLSLVAKATCLGTCSMKSRLHQLMLCQKITCSTSVLITAGLLDCLRPAQLVGRVWDDLPVYWELLYVKDNMLQNIHIYLLS